MMEAWCTGHSRFALLAPPGSRSAAVSALRLAPGVNSPAVVGALAARGWLAAPGLDIQADAVLRIGHMGDLEPSHLEAFLAALDAVV